MLWAMEILKGVSLSMSTADNRTNTIEDNDKHNENWLPTFIFRESRIVAVQFRVRALTPLGEPHVKKNRVYFAIDRGCQIANWAMHKYTRFFLAGAPLSALKMI